MPLSFILFALILVTNSKIIQDCQVSGLQLYGPNLKTPYFKVIQCKLAFYPGILAEQQCAVKLLAIHHAITRGWQIVIIICYYAMLIILVMKLIKTPMMLIIMLVDRVQRSPQPYSNLDMATVDMQAGCVLMWQHYWI